MSFFSEVFNIGSTVANNICSTLGENILYQNGGNAPITIKALPEKTDKTIGVLLGGNEENTIRKFYIPANQKDGNGAVLFPPTTGPAVYDLITYPTNATYSYSIVRVKADCVGAGYLIEARRHHLTNIGAGAT